MKQNVPADCNKSQFRHFKITFGAKLFLIEDVQIKDQTACAVQSDLDLRCQQN